MEGNNNNNKKDILLNQMKILLKENKIIIHEEVREINIVKRAKQDEILQEGVLRDGITKYQFNKAYRKEAKEQVLKPMKDRLETAKTVQNKGAAKETKNFIKETKKEKAYLKPKSYEHMKKITDLRNEALSRTSDKSAAELGKEAAHAPKKELKEYFFILEDSVILNEGFFNNLFIDMKRILVAPWRAFRNLFFKYGANRQESRDLIDNAVKNLDLAKLIKDPQMIAQAREDLKNIKGRGIKSTDEIERKFLINAMAFNKSNKKRNSAGGKVYDNTETGIQTAIGLRILRGQAKQQETHMRELEDSFQYRRFRNYEEENNERRCLNRYWDNIRKTTGRTILNGMKY